MRTGAIFALMVLAAQAAVLDRVAVTVGQDVIAESEVIEEIRLTDFLNQAPLDLGPAARRTAAERMVDQELIRREIKLEAFSAPAPDVAQTLRDFKQAHFRTHAQYTAALKKYGVSEEDLKAYLSWQASALRFTEQRFRPEKPETNDAAAADDPMEAWLKQERAQTKIQFHKEALE